MAGSSLRFSVEVSADKATQALQVLSQSFDQAGISAKSALLGIGNATKPAGQAVTTLGDQMRQFARGQRQEAAASRWYVSELASVIPVAGNAKTALVGLGSAIVGGAGVATAIGLLTTGLGLLKSAYDDAAKAMKAADDGLKASAISLAEATGKANELEAALRGGARAAAEVRYGNAASAESEKVRKITEEIAQKRADLASDDENTLEGLGREVRVKKEIVALENQREEALQRLRAASLEFQASEEKANQERAGKATKEVDAANVVADAKIKAGTRAYEEETKRIVERVKLAEQAAIDEANARGEIENFAVAAAERQRKRAEELSDWWKEFNAEVAKVERDMAKEAGENAKAMVEPFANAFAEGVADLATNAKTAGQVIQSVAKQVIQSVLQMAMKSITAKALDAGAGAAASQSSVPIVGPALAAAAMAAMVGTVMGLMGKMPSAKGGWWNVPNDTLALIHKDEKVLPADKSRALDRLLADGGGSGGGGAPVFNITTPDAESFYRMLKNRDSELFKVLNEGARDRRFG